MAYGYWLATGNETFGLFRSDRSEPNSIVAIIELGVEESDESIAQNPERFATGVSDVARDKIGRTNRSRILDSN